MKKAGAIAAPPRCYWGTSQVLLGHLPGAIGAPSRCYWGTFQVLLGHLPGAIGAPSRCYWGTFQVLLGHLPGAIGAPSRCYWGTFQVLLGHPSLRNYRCSGSLQVTNLCGTSAPVSPPGEANDGFTGRHPPDPLPRSLGTFIARAKSRPGDPFYLHYRGSCLVAG